MGQATYAAKTLQVRLCRLTLAPISTQGWGVRLETGAASFAQAQPVALEVVGTDGAAHWLMSGYQSVIARAGSLVGTGTVTTKLGSVLK